MNATLFAGENYLREVLDAFPSPVLIVDRNLEIKDANRASRELLQEESEIRLKHLCGDLMQCLHARQSEGGCGTTKHCRKVRDDKDFWQNVEDYLGKHVDLQFSHGICPACAQKHYSDLDLNAD